MAYEASRKPANSGLGSSTNAYSMKTGRAAWWKSPWVWWESTWGTTEGNKRIGLCWGWIHLPLHTRNAKMPGNEAAVAHQRTEKWAPASGTRRMWLWWNIPFSPLNAFSSCMRSVNNTCIHSADALAQTHWFWVKHLTNRKRRGPVCWSQP